MQGIGIASSAAKGVLSRTHISRTPRALSHLPPPLSLSVFSVFYCSVLSEQKTERIENRKYRGRGGGVVDEGGDGGSCPTIRCKRTVGEEFVFVSGLSVRPL
jgi:hypothetical protein